MKPYHIIAVMLQIGAGLALSQETSSFEGYADQKSARETAWGSDEDEPKQILVKFHIVRSSRWDASSTAPLSDVSANAKVQEALAQINSIYSASRILFTLDSVAFSTPDTALRNIDSFDEKAKLMKLLITETDARNALNIVVVPMRNLGFDGHADFPWGRNSLRQGSGVMVSDEYVFPFPISVSPLVESLLNPQILAHEIGHALGLHHLERGVSGHETADPRLVQEPATVSTNGDTKGDFCHDTPPISHFSERDLIYTPIPPNEQNPEFSVVYKPERSVLRWDGKDVANLMRASGDRFLISPEQSQRMHSWIDARLSSWVIGTPDSDPKALLSNLYFNSQNKFLPGVRLTWSGNGGNHIVERSVSPIFPSGGSPALTQILTSTAANSWDDSSAQIGVDYWYRVKKAAGGSYTYSRRMSVRGAGGSEGQKARPSHIPDLSAASAVRSIPNGVLVTWDDADDIDITGYQVLRWEVGNPTAAPLKSDPITSAGGGKSSFFDVFSESEQQIKDKKDFHYQILSFAGDYTNKPVFSGNVAAPLEQGRKLTYSATPPPAPPILPFTKYRDSSGAFKGKISVTYSGITPNPVTENSKITATLTRSIDGGSNQTVYTGDLPGGVNSPILFTDSGLATGKNYFYELSLKQMVETSNEPVLVLQNAEDYSTTRIPGRITTSPIRGLPAADSQGVFSYPTFTWTPVLDAAAYRITINSPGINPVTHTVLANQLFFSLTGTELEALRQYNWSVTASNDEGDGPVSTKGKFTVGLRAVNLISPSVGQQLVTVGDEKFAHPTFTWDGMPGAVEYRLRVFNGSGTVVYNSGFIGTNRHTVASDVLNSGNYTWEVTTRPADTSNTTPVSVSAVRAFSVRSAPNLVPARYQPVDGVSGARQRPIFEWEKLSQATEYVIQIVQNSDTSIQWRFGGDTELGYPNLLGGPLVGSPVVGQTNRLQFEFPASIAELPGARLFYWRIRARNEIGNGDWSAAAGPDTVLEWRAGWNSFTTRLDPPLIASPTNGATINAATPTLTWTSGRGTDSNELQVFSGTATTGTPAASATVTGNTWTFPDLIGDGTYTWRVRSLGPPNQNPRVISAWTEAAFNVVTPPRSAPSPIKPYKLAEEHLNQQVLTNFQWSPLAKATSYRIEIRKGTTTFFNRSGITGTAYTLPAVDDLDFATQYTWRISGASVTGEGPASTWFPFRTELQTSAPSTPTNASTVNDRTPILRAVVVTSATNYKFEVRKDTTTSPIYASGTSADGANHWTVDPFLSNGTYHWRVQAIGAPSGQTNSPWSAYSSLIVDGPPTNAPTQISPADNATGVSRTPTLTWSNQNLATSYDIQINDSHGGALVVDRVGISTPFTVNKTLIGGRSYFWRVRSRNAVGTGPWTAADNIWSDYFVFTTK